MLSYTTLSPPHLPRKAGLLMRRITLLLISMALTVCVAASAAVAAEIQCLDGTPCYGTNQADTLTGTALPDEIYGLGGPDVIYGLGGPDFISGGSGGDEVRGGADGDFLVGAAGDDEIRGSYGADVIRAENGDDTVFGGGGTDTIHVEGDQQYGFQDEVFCGGVLDQDVLFVDPNDILHNCLL